MYSYKKHCWIPSFWGSFCRYVQTYLNLSSSLNQCPIFEPGDVCRRWTFSWHTLEENSISLCDCLILGTIENIFQTWNIKFKIATKSSAWFHLDTANWTYFTAMTKCVHPYWITFKQKGHSVCPFLNLKDDDDIKQTDPVGMTVPSWRGWLSSSIKSSLGVSRWRLGHASYCTALWEARGHFHTNSSMVIAGTPHKQENIWNILSSKYWIFWYYKGSLHLFTFNLILQQIYSKDADLCDISLSLS